MKMTYNRAQVMAAADFIWQFNESVCLWPSMPNDPMDVFEDILNFGRTHGMRNMQGPVKDWTSWSGTGGFMVLFASEDDDSFNIDVYVDPGLLSEYRHVEEFIDEDYDEQ